jgi:hypothetical protein
MLRLDAILTLCAVILVTLTGTNAQAKFEWGFSVRSELPSPPWVSADFAYSKQSLPRCPHVKHSP